MKFLFTKKKVPFTKRTDEEKKKSTSKSDIKIKVYLRFGAEIRQKRAEYWATEKRDNYNNLVAINEEIGHNEDIDFTQEDVYTAMNITLGVSGKDKTESLNVIENKTRKIKLRIKAIEKHPELNKYANIWDEKRKLRELEIYANYLKNRSDHGAYFKIEDGIRTYEYESIDGFLIPIWHGADNLSDYPDFTRKKKITMQETANINAYFDSKGGKKILINALIVVLIITTVMFFVNVYAGFKLVEKHGEIDDRSVEASEICAIESAKTYTVFNTIMNDAFIQEYKTKKDIEEKAKIVNETESLIKTLLPNK
jgi:hypothetical protein